MRSMIVITGPTGSGKSDLAVEAALHFGCDIISADSRQIYRDIPIVTAAPTADQLAAVRHHFVGILPLESYYSAARYEADVMAMLPEMWGKSDTVVVCGGSMMYIDALTRGIDELPDISDAVRREAYAIYERGGLQQLRLEVLERDPVYYREVDLNNPKRLIHAIEICMEAGCPYSSLRTGQTKPRDFEIITFAIDYPREELFDRINRRVDKMVAAGLEDEARSVYDRRHLNSLNTVGLKEMFAYFDGEMDRATAIARIAKNTRVYAKKQLTWLKKRPETHLLDPSRPLLPQLLEAMHKDIGKHT